MARTMKIQIKTNAEALEDFRQTLKALATGRRIRRRGGVYFTSVGWGTGSSAPCSVLVEALAVPLGDPALVVALMIGVRGGLCSPRRRGRSVDMDKATSTAYLVLLALNASNRELRLWRRLFALAVLAAVSVGVMGQMTMKNRSVEAQRFVLLDAAGKARGGFIMDADRPKLVLFDKSGKARAGLALATDGSPSLALHDGEERPRAGFSLESDRVYLSLYGSGGKGSAGLAVGSDGAVILLLRDREEKERVGVTVTPSGVPTMEFLDKDGRVIWKAP
jgi:hypothetical protein